MVLLQRALSSLSVDLILLPPPPHPAAEGLQRRCDLFGQILMSSHSNTTSPALSLSDFRRRRAINFPFCDFVPAAAGCGTNTMLNGMKSGKGRLIWEGRGENLSRYIASLGRMLFLSFFSHPTGS